MCSFKERLELFLYLILCYGKMILEISSGHLGHCIFYLFFSYHLHSHLQLWAIHNFKLTGAKCLWTVEGHRRTWRKPTKNTHTVTPEQ